MNTATLVIFGLVYLGMILGEIPGLALDRTGVALLGAIAVVAVGREPLGELRLCGWCCGREELPPPQNA